MASALTPPRLEGGEGDEHRHSTWLELFFDLVFVVAVAQLSHRLVEHPTIAGFLQFLVLFVPVWWAWVGFTFYATRFESDDDVDRILWLTAMLAAAAMAVSVDGALDEHSARFAISYAALRAVLVVLYLIAPSRDASARELSTFLATTFAIGNALWWASAVVPEPARFWLWGAGLAIEILTPLIGSQVLARTAVHPWHLPERFGLFMIIVLGESVAAIVVGTSNADWQLESALVAGAGFVAVASIWWSYFDFAALTARYGLLGSPRRGQLARDLYSYGHFPIVVGLTMIGAGTELAIEEASEGHLSAGTRWVLCGGVALYLLSVSGLYAGTTRSIQAGLWWPRIAAGAVALFLGFVGGDLDPIVFAAILTAAIAGHLAVELATAEQLTERHEGPFGGARVPAAFVRAAARAGTDRRS